MWKWKVKVAARDGEWRNLKKEEAEIFWYAQRIDSLHFHSILQREGCASWSTGHEKKNSKQPQEDNFSLEWRKFIRLSVQFHWKKKIKNGPLSCYHPYAGASIRDCTLIWIRQLNRLNINLAKLIIQFSFHPAWS